MDSIKIYARSALMNLRAQLEYPQSFFMQTLSQFVMLGGELLAVLLIIDRFHALGAWTGPNLLFFFGLLSFEFYLCECFMRGVTNFSPHVRTGRMDIFFTRPRGVLMQVLCYDFDYRRFGAILVALASLISGANASGVLWSADKLLCLMCSIIGSMALISGLFLIDAALCIFSVKSMEVINALTYGGRSACQYPIDIYPKPIKLLFIVVAPFALTTHLPGAYILGRELFPGVPGVMAFVSPLSGLLLLFITYIVFRRALTHYRSTGS